MKNVLRAFTVLAVVALLSGNAIAGKTSADLNIIDDVLLEEATDLDTSDILSEVQIDDLDPVKVSTTKASKGNKPKEASSTKVQKKR